MININCKASNPFGSYDEFVQFMVSENEFHIDKAFAALRDGKAYAIHTDYNMKSGKAYSFWPCDKKGYLSVRIFKAPNSYDTVEMSTKAAKKILKEEVGI